MNPVATSSPNVITRKPKSADFRSADLIFCIAAPAIIIAMLTATAPYIGLGSGPTFLFFREFGLSRTDILNIAIAFTVAALLISPLYAIGVIVFARSSKHARAGLHPTAASNMPKIQEGILFGNWRHAGRELIYGAAIGVFVCFVFAICLWKHGSEYAVSHDQHWHQSLIDSSLNFGRFSFSLAGNPLYSFDIQLPLNANLLPLHSIAHLLPAAFRIPFILSECFIVSYALFLILGNIFGLRLGSAMVFAGAMALLMTTRGLDHFFWITPRAMLDPLFPYALWWGEEPLLLLAGVLAYFCTGRQHRAWANFGMAVVFAALSFAIIFCYPVGIVYFLPLLGIYCAVFLLTSRGSELLWKLFTALVLCGILLALHVPLFVIDLYSYTFGDYFLALLTPGSPGHPVPAYQLLSLIWGDILDFVHADNLRAFFVFNVAMLSAALAALKFAGPLRRVAIASLVCEIAILLLKVINQLCFRLPMSLDYAQVGHAPIWGSFFILACLFATIRIDVALASLSLTRPGSLSKVAAWGAANARPILFTVIVLAMSRFVLLEPTDQSPWVGYPAARSPSIALLSERLALADGSPFRGRLLTLGTSQWNGEPDWIQPNGWGIFASYFTRYRSSTGNDHFVDAAAFSIPTTNEYGHWTSPVYFTMLRSFFARPTDSFDKAIIPLRAFDLRIARMLGVRMVVTDRDALPGGILVYSTGSNGDPLNIFEIDRTNLGQFSPTRLYPISSARDAIALLHSPEFEPEHMAIVENRLPDDLVAVENVQVKTVRGPRLQINAASNGRSLVTLPFEYSHCLILRTENKTARLYPVNLLMAGLLFEGRLDATIEYRYGILDNYECRRADIERADALHLRNVFSGK